MIEFVKSLLWACVGGNSLHFRAFQVSLCSKLVVRWYGPRNPDLQRALVWLESNFDGWVKDSYCVSFRKGK